MRLRQAAPWLLLLTPSLADVADTFQQARDIARSSEDSQALPVVRRDGIVEPVGAVGTRGTTATKPYRGTEDAPVDGLDGKPHTGPFVDTTPEEVEINKNGVLAATTTTAKTVPTSLQKFADSTGDDSWHVNDIPEKIDGVMNDVNRVAPKKGTTGTEGGISGKEKEKDRLFGRPAEKTPQAPTEAPPLPHSEEQRIDAEQGRLANKSSAKPTTREEDNAAQAPKRKIEEIGSGGLKLEKPDDLPEKPHNIPMPEPQSGKGPTIDTKTQSSTVSSPTDDPDGLADHDSWHEWFHSFVLSYTMILVSEVGDKTFLIAALMAMRHSRLLVFSAALGALVVMTVLSAVLGHAFPTLLPKRLTTAAAALLFLVFGIKMLREGLDMAPDLGVTEEMKEVEAELEEKEHSMALDRSRQRTASLSAEALEAGRGRTGSRDGGNPSYERDGFSTRASPPSSPQRDGEGGSQFRLSGLINLCSLILSPAWVQTFVMTFLGEWGDRSQIATIAMAAGQDYWWVTLGAITGHACCTGLAVIGGRALAGRVSLRVVTIGGAVAFLVFAVIYLFESYTDAS